MEDLKRQKKSEIRKNILDKLKSQKEEYRRQKSLVVKKKLFSLAEFKKAKRILLYVSKYYEVDTKPIIKEVLEEGKNVFLPVTDTKGRKLIISEISDLENDIELGPYGIYQPGAKCKRLGRLGSLDLLLMPGVGFDKKGSRLGHGAGYYDRLLKDIPHNIIRIGLAFDFQVQDEDIPQLASDMPVTRVVTN
jgi:5-formyltetrahydrofolate cyclo-ligase